MTELERIVLSKEPPKVLLPDRYIAMLATAADLGYGSKTNPGYLEHVAED